MGRTYGKALSDAIKKKKKRKIEVTDNGLDYEGYQYHLHRTNQKSMYFLLKFIKSINLLFARANKVFFSL